MVQEPWRTDGADRRAPAVTVMAGPGHIEVSWEPVRGAATGSAPILRYVATAALDDGSTPSSCTAEPPSTSCMIGDLNPGMTYSVSVGAENAVGSGPSSDATALPTRRFAERQVIEPQADGASGVHTADLDGDGDIDVL